MGKPSDLTVDFAVEALKACRVLDRLGLFDANGYDRMFDRIYTRTPTRYWAEVMDLMKDHPG